MTRPKFLSLMLVASLAAAPGAHAKQLKESTSTGKSFAHRQSPECGIARFADLRPGLSRGGEPYEDGYSYLQKHGYKTVVSFLTNPAESTLAAQHGMKFIHIPIQSGPFSCQLPSDAQVKQFLSVVTDTTLYPMYIHCHAGKDRTGAMSAIYRMEACGWTNDEAVQEMKAFGFAGRYKRLYNFVQTYTPHPALAAAPADTVVTTTAP